MRAQVFIVVLLVAALFAGTTVPAAAQTASQSVTLAVAMTSAVEHHPSVVVAARAVEAAQARLVQARAGTALTVSVNGRASAGTLSVGGTPTGGGTTTSHNVSLDASLPIYDGGITAVQVAQAQAGVDSAQAALAAARQDAALAAAQAYFAVLRAQRTVEVREAALRSAQSQLAQAEAFFRAGTGAQADVIKAQAAVAGAQADLVTARGQVETSLASLRGAMALPLAQAITVEEPVAPVVRLVAPQEAATTAAAQRSEVRRAEAEIKSAQAALRIAEIRAGLIVSVSANGVVQVTPNAGDTGWSVSATVSYPVVDGGRSKAAVEEARANVAAATARRDATVLQIQTQAYQAAASVRDTSARVEAQRVSAEAADAALRVAEGRYRAGVGTLLEVLDAQTSATSARIAAVQALYDLHLAVVNLQYSLGQPLVSQ